LIADAEILESGTEDGEGERRVKERGGWRGWW
jgi:hypothetical protein